MGQSLFKYKHRPSYDEKYAIALSEKELKTIIDALNRHHDYSAKRCEEIYSHVTDGSAGACYHYEALPCKRMAEDFKGMIDRVEEEWRSNPENLREDYNGE